MNDVLIVLLLTIFGLLFFWPIIFNYEMNRREVKIMAKLDELVGIITVIVDQLAKAKQEILQRIADLEAALTNVEIPADAQLALDALREQAQNLDDVVPDMD